MIDIEAHKEFPMVYISVLNWMNYADCLNCIESIMRLNYTNFHLIVRDNNSPNDSFERIREVYPDVMLVRSSENNGFAAGHYENFLIAQKEGADLFWILNSDLEVDPNALNELVSCFQLNGEHIYGSVSLDPGDHLKVDFGGSAFTDKSNKELTYNSWKNKLYADLIKEHPEKYSVESVEGSSMLIPISVVEKHGFMKFDFFMYAEETDFCYRMRKFGIESIIATRSIVMHKNEGSTNVFPQLKKIPVYYRRRNAMRFSIEHFNLSRWKALSYPDGIISNLKTILKGIFSKNKDLNYFYALGSLHAFLGKKGKTVKPEKLIR